MFDCNDVVNYGMGGWKDGKFCTFLDQGLLCIVKLFAGEVVDRSFFTLSLPGSLEAVVVFEVIRLVIFSTLWALVVLKTFSN